MPDQPSPHPEDVGPFLRRNIDSLRRHREQEEAQSSRRERVAQKATDIIGSLGSIYFHMLAIGAWIAANLGLIPVRPWDPSFVMLAMIASVEAIFLAVFILITQNRMQRIADKRDDLNLQISLLAEHEITRIVTLVAGIADKLGVAPPHEEEIAELQREVKPEAVLREIDKEEEKSQ